MSIKVSTLKWLASVQGADLDLIPEIRSRRFNVDKVYRVYNSFTSLDPVSKRDDVIAPIHRVEPFSKKRMKLVSEPCVRLFYYGAEGDLMRYLLWLRKVYLREDIDDLTPVYVAEQASYEAQQDLRELYPDVAVRFIGPNELDHHGLLSGRKASSEAYLLY